ncbi:IS6 family transposase [Deinococcus sp. KSM4-11]|uniref:IS6 family transposase n=1 Tax=Deinococcus sp. KSM4-11 TaxID=2568654 RepID=UPI0010A2FAD0|nr:IS6 family transposase [Deinococcus sp. KSM4-11]THF85417.1 IS6 family transposase [Deinococcus sp. KSM4-11]
MTDPTPYRHRFPMTIIQHAVWLYHRFPLRYRDVQELLHQRGIEVSHETLREWCITFSALFADDLRQREPRRGSRWLMDEVCTTVNGVRHWLWRAVDEHGFVLDILLQRHRDTKAAQTFLTRLLSEYDVPEVIHTDKLWRYGAALRERPVLHTVEHVQVVSTARCNNVIEQSHRSTRRHERQQQGFKRRKRVQEFLCLHASIENLHHHTRASVPAFIRRNNQKQAFQTWSAVTAGVA